MSSRAIWVLILCFQLKLSNIQKLSSDLHLKGRLPTHLWHVKILYSPAASLN